MTSFLFWNVMKKDLRDTIARAVAERDVDILLLAENGTADTDLAAALKRIAGQPYLPLSDDDDKVRIFTRLKASQWRRRQKDALNARMGIWSVKVGKPPGILLATAHLLSKNNASEDEQAMLATEVAKEICRVEERAGHERTIVVGDLNMNPFEGGIAGAYALHAVMTKQVAQRIERIFQGRSYRFFYNPMWGLFGDRTSGPPGTSYHSAARFTELFWHMFDQVLVRPSLMDLLHDLVILDSIGGVSLLSHPGGLPRESEL